MGERSKYCTRAHEELLSYLKATPGKHHTAAEIKAYFSGRGEPFGSATIYRHLERFVDEGPVCTQALPRARTRVPSANETNRVICGCCMGDGCECCGFTGWVRH